MKLNSKVCFNCIQLDHGTLLTLEQYSDISKLIYQTDPFIYPALFGAGLEGLRTATEILPVIFEEKQDPMFSKNNLFLMLYEDEIVGLILWYKGILNWSPKCIIEVASEKEIDLDRFNLDLVRNEYIHARYSTGAESSKNLALINVCIKERFRHRGIGAIILSNFVNIHRGDTLELTVLADNTSAISLYRKQGFKIFSETEGFSLNSVKPRCFIMKREPEAQ